VSNTVIVERHPALRADFVAEVPIEIGEGRRCGPLLPLAPAGAAAVTL